MGHKQKNLKMQVNDRLKACCAFGESKHATKLDGSSSGKIFSYQTLHTYKAQMYRFCDFVRENHPGTKTLDDARQYVNEWLQNMIDAEQSPHTIKTAASAAAKTFGCRTTAFIQTPARNRANLIRSRKRAIRDSGFNESRPDNAELVEFCKSTGLRRSELQAARGSWLIENENGIFLDLTHTTSTKGGRPRIVPVIGDVELVKRLCKNAGDGKIFPVVNSHADIHSYRAVYCRRAYDSKARDVSQLPRSERYHCQKDKAGEVYDRLAMKFASEALGHARINVIAASYLYTVSE